MAADIFNYDDLEDLRYNAFTNTYDPRTIGYGESSPEERTIPSIAPFIIKLFNSPIETVPRQTKITLKSTGEILKEVSKNTTPANKQYAINYEELGNGQVLFNAGQAGQVVYINYKTVGTIHQKSTLKFQIFGSASTKIVASSDSSTGSQEIADEIILTTEDAGAKINSIITELSAIGGGEIKILEGIYNCSTEINTVSGINLKGSGYATILKRSANTTFIIDNSDDNVIISDLRIDGNKSLYTGSGIRQLSYKSYINNVWSENNNSSGFFSVYNLSNSYSYNNNGFGLVMCEYINNTHSYLNGSFGFEQCNYLNNCKSYNNTGIGFDACSYITTCYSHNNTLNGFGGCIHVTSSKAYSNGGDGFRQCDGVTNCNSTANTGDGFDACDAIRHNRSVSNGGSNYTATCYADWGGSIAVSDDSAGAWNG